MTPEIKLHLVQRGEYVENCPIQEEFDKAYSILNKECGINIKYFWIDVPRKMWGVSFHEGLLNFSIRKHLLGDIKFDMYTNYWCKEMYMCQGDMGWLFTGTVSSIELVASIINNYKNWNTKDDK